MITVDSTWDAANAILAKQPFVALEIDGYARVFTNRNTGLSGQHPWIVEDGISSVQFNTDPLNGTSELQDVTITVLDYQSLITLDMATVTMEGRNCRLKVWFPGVTFANAAVLFSGRLELVQSSNTYTSYDFVLKDSQVRLKQLIYLTGDDGQPTDSSHLRTFIGHPLDILFDILTSPLHISTDDIDVAKLVEYRDGPFAGSIFQFSLDSPPDAKDFIENQIMKPLGGCLRTTPGGILTPYFMISLTGTVDPVMSFDEDSIVDVPLVGQADLVNTVTYRFDKGDNGFGSESVKQNATSIAQYGSGTHIVESDGMRSTYQAFFLANIVSREIFNRLSTKNPTFDAEVLFTGAKCEVSDIISITHALMPDRKAGVLGVTDAWFQIQSLTYDLNKFTVTLTLVDVSASKAYGAYRVAPDTQTSWQDVATTTGQKNRYMFISNVLGKMGDGADGNPLG